MNSNNKISQEILIRFQHFFRWLVTAKGIIAVMVLIVLGYFVLLPAIFMVYESLTISPGDLYRFPGMEEGDFTLNYWQRTFTSWARFLGPLRNTLYIGIGTTVLVVIIGSFLAWLTTLTNVPFKGILGLLSILSYLMPSWAFAMAWTEVFQHRGVGRPTGFFTYYTGIQVPEWLVFGPIPIILVSTLHYFPFIYLMVKAALENLDSQLEESASLLGASRLHILGRITLPLVTPAILSAAILAFSRVIGTFATPSLLGIPAGYTVLSTQLYSLMRYGRMSEALSIAFSLIVFCTIITFLNNKVIGTRKSYVALGGKGAKKRLFNLGRLRYPVGIGVIIMLVVLIIFPLGLLGYSSLMLNSGDWSLANLSSHWWIGEGLSEYAEGEPGILRNPMVWRGMLNTLRVAVVAALFCGIFGFLIGYVVVRLRGTKIAGIIDSLAFIPIVIPSIAFGAVYLSIYAEPRPYVPMLYGSFLLLVFVAFAKRVPYTTRTGVSAMHQIGPELEEAAEIQGAGIFLRVRKILFPLARPGILAGSLLVITTTIRELSLFILLMSPGNRVLTAQTFTYNEIGAWQLSNALITFIVILALSIAGIIKLYEKRTARSM